MKKSSPPANTRTTKVLEYGFAFIIFVWIVGGAIYFYDTFQDRKLMFTVKNPTELYQSSDLKIGIAIGRISPGENIKVLRVLFIDDHLVVQVATSRQTGWILKPSDVSLK